MTHNEKRAFLRPWHSFTMLMSNFVDLFLLLQK